MIKERKLQNFKNEAILSISRGIFKKYIYIYKNKYSFLGHKIRYAHSIYDLNLTESRKALITAHVLLISDLFTSMA